MIIKSCSKSAICRRSDSLAYGFSLGDNRGASALTAILAWGQAGFTVEKPGEVAGVIVAHFKCNIDDAFRCLTEFLTGGIDPEVQVILHGRHSGCGLEQPGEVKFA